MPQPERRGKPASPDLLVRFVEGASLVYGLIINGALVAGSFRIVSVQDRLLAVAGLLCAAQGILFLCRWTRWRARGRALGVAGVALKLALGLIFGLALFAERNSSMTDRVVGSCLILALFWWPAFSQFLQVRGAGRVET